MSRAEIPAEWETEPHGEPMAAVRLRSLFECLGEVAECRHARGKRYPLKTVLAIAVAARLAGYALRSQLEHLRLSRSGSAVLHTKG